jgi:hypothetical protein
LILWFIFFIGHQPEDSMEIGLRIDNKIKELYPDIERNRVQVHCDYDDRQALWRVQFKKGKYVLKTLLEETDVNLLLAGKRCLSLTVELQQLSDSIKILESQ